MVITMPSIWGKKKEEKEKPSEDTVSQKLLEICGNIFNFPLILKKMTEAAHKILFLKTEGFEKLTKKQWEEQYKEAKGIIEDARNCLKTANLIRPDVIDQVANKLLDGNIPSQFKKLFLPTAKPEQPAEESEKQIEEILEGKQEEEEEQQSQSPLLAELSKEEE